MEDIKLVEKCLICNKNLMLMASVRADESRRIFLVKRCLNCGGHPVEEVIEIKLNNEKICKYCDSENIEATRQFSDESGKINTVWHCLNCNKNFKTIW